MREEKPKKLRLFIGSYLDFSPVEKEAAEKLSEHFACPVRFIAPPNIHLTWKFIGETEEENLEKITNIAEETASQVSDIDINFDKFEIWHKRGIPTLLVLTGHDLNGNAEKLHQKLDKKLGDLKIPRENRKFLPHITLARFKASEKPSEKITLPEWLSFKETRAKFSKLCVFQSASNGKESVYSPLRSLKLS